MKINAGEIRVGMLLEHKNDLWQVLKTQHVKPGKGGAFAQVEMKSLNKNTKLNERFRSSETVEKASLEEMNYNYLYEDENNYFFMEPKSFEQIEIKKSLIGEKGKLLTENLEVSVSFYNELPISVDLPKQVVCKIETTDVALKGQTVSSSYKPAKLNNGLNIQVPPFIESGDEVIIPAPYYSTYEEIAKIWGAKVIPIQTNTHNNFTFSFDDFELALSEKTKLVVLVSPSNPTGTVLSKDLIDKVSETGEYGDDIQNAFKEALDKFMETQTW